MGKRKFPYYIVVDVDSAKKKIKILDLNSIQEEVLDENGKSTREFEYVPDETAHDIKWITVPGSTKTQQDAIIKWINEMVYADGPHPNKYIVYDHRRHFTDPFHEEYKVDTFIEWEAALEALDEETEEEETEEEE